MPHPPNDPDAPDRAPGPPDRAPDAPPQRVVHTGDGIAWLAAARLPSSHAVVTSLPDVSEMKPMTLDAWQAWFVETAALVCAQTADDAVAIFYQTDIRVNEARGSRWIDKGHLVATGADRAGSVCIAHKIVCRAPPGTATFGRPGFAHLLVFSRTLRADVALSTPDVLPALGEMSWARAMGTAACEEACRFLLRATPCRVVADPFCGLGTALAVANAYGMDAVGVEKSAKRSRQARALRFVRGTGLV